MSRVEVTLALSTSYRMVALLCILLIRRAYSKRTRRNLDMEVFALHRSMQILFSRVFEVDKRFSGENSRTCIFSQGFSRKQCFWEFRQAVDNHCIDALQGGALVIEVWMRHNISQARSTFIPENPFIKNMMKTVMDEESADC